MGIRILCLHGMGVDANVFRVQTASFRFLLPSDYNFTFIDGPVFCDPSPGAADFYDGPYRCWFNTPSREKIARCHDQILDHINQEGPFDLVMGFSQGGALAASLLLHHQLDRPDTRPMFKAAIFICSPMPFSRSIRHGIDVRTYFGIEPTTKVDRPNTVPDHLIADKYFLRNDQDLLASSSEGSSETSSLHDDKASESSHSKPGGVASGLEPEKSDSRSSDFGGPFYNIFHPNVDECRIDIPTGHIYGRKDNWRSHSMELVGMCSKSAGTVTFEHDGGHEVPREASEEICDLIEEVVARAALR